MTYTSRRMIAAAGVGLAAIVAAFVVVPATIRLGEVAGLWSASIALGVPVATILAVSGTPLHGPWRSTLGGVVVGALTCVVTFTAALQVVANVMGGETSGLMLSVALYGSPAVSVLLFGTCSTLLARRPSTPAAAVTRDPVADVDEAPMRLAA